MRHRKGGFKLKRDPSARRALLRSLTTSIILHERIETTVTKAKAVRPQIEKMITLAKRDTLHSRRQAAAFLYEPAAVKKLFDMIGPRFADRNGGYTRIIRLRLRQGDGAEIAILELLGTQMTERVQDKKLRREERLLKQQEAAKAKGEESPEATLDQDTEVEAVVVSDEASTIEAAATDSDESGEPGSAAAVEVSDVQDPGIPREAVVEVIEPDTAGSEESSDKDSS